MYNNTYMKNHDYDENTIDLDADTVSESTQDEVQFEELDWVGDEKKDKEKLRDLRAQLKQSQAESREHLTALQRSRADYVNLQRELSEVRDSIKKKTTLSVIEDVLPVLDSFDMAMGNTDAWNAVDANWRMGVEFIYNQLKTVLEGYGITAIESTGVLFDPNIHEPIQTVPTDDQSQDDIIQKIIQKGYKTSEKVIRPAKVVVWNLNK
jgi:molecular chaperone GrpE